MLSVGVFEPFVVKYIVKLDAIGLVYDQTGFDQIVNVSIEHVEFENITFGVETTVENVEVLFERYVAVDHIEEENAQRPDGGPIAVVLLRADPFRRRVDARAVKVVQLLLLLLFVLEKRAGAEVDELDAIRAQIDEDVLVLDVPVQNAQLADAQHDLHDLSEVVARHALAQADAVVVVVVLDERQIGDVVEQVLAVLVAFHYDDETVLLLHVVQDFYAAFHISHLQKKKKLI